MSAGSDERAAPVATGTLSSTPLAHALVYARNRRLSGFFELRAVDPLGDREASIGFWRGRICSVTITPRSHYLGALLYELGHIDAETLGTTLQIIADTRRLHGEVLVERGHITKEQRDKGLAEQACRKVHSLFEYPLGSGFAFYEARASLEEPKLLVDPIVPIWRGIRDNPSAANVRDVLDRYPTSAFKMINEAPLDRIAFSPEEKALAKTITTKLLTLAQLRASSKLPVAQVDLFCYLLVIAKCVEPVSPSQTAMMAITDAQVMSIAPPPPSSRPIIRPGGATPSATWRASAASIQMGAVRPPSGEMSMPPPSFRIPSNPAMAAAAATIEPAQGPSDLGGTGIALRAASIEHEDYFTALGLPEGASMEAVRASYFRLAKVWHPDRLPRELEPFRPEVGAIFAHLTRAHGTLTDDIARKGYLATRARTSNAPASMREKKVPVEMLREVDKAIARRDFSGAEAHGMAARDSYGDDADALAVWGWAHAHAAEAPEEILRAAMVDLDKAVQMNDDSVRARYYRGMVQKRLGNTSAAMRDFTHVTKLDPNHTDATRELRLFNMRAGGKKK